MPAKRKVTIKRKPKVEVKDVTLEEAIEEIGKEDVIEEETPVTTVVEKQITAPRHVKMKDRVLGDVGGSKITKPVGRIRFEAQVWPYPMFMVPAEIRNYLTKKGLTTDVWKKDKEWLEKHNVDLEMVEKLKQFLQSKM